MIIYVSNLPRLLSAIAAILCFILIYLSGAIFLRHPTAFLFSLPILCGFGFVAAAGVWVDSFGEGEHW